MGHHPPSLPLQLVRPKEKAFTFHHNRPRTDKIRIQEMTHLPLPWWPKPTSGDGSAAANPPRTDATASSCCGLSKLMRRLKKRSKMLQPGSRQSSFQCRYDPLSYSLNFDRSSSGDFADEEYYRFYAFSSRFVATPRTDCQRLVAASH